MKNVEDSSTGGSNSAFVWQVAVAHLLLRNARDLKACGLTPEQYDLMLHLKGLRQRERRTLSDLAARIQTDVVTCAFALERLRQRHLVRSRRLGLSEPATSRLTAKGEALLRRLSRRDRNRWRRLAPCLLSSIRAAAQENCDDLSQDSRC